MENYTPSLETLIANTGHCLKKSAELYKLKALDKSSDALSSLSVGLVLTITASVFLLLLTMGAVLWLGEFSGKLYIGFFLVSGFYAFLFLLFYLCRNAWIKNPIKNAIITQVLTAAK
jgi:hypothetical protein